MFKFERTMKKGKKPDMTPLIDIIFQLILFFMLTTTFVKVNAIDIYVNDVKPGMPSQLAPTSLPLVVSLKGKDLLLGREKISRAQLASALGSELGNDKNRAVKLVTEKGVKLQALVDIIDIVKAAGGSNIMLDAAGNHTEESAKPGSMPMPIPLPELQSTKAMSEKLNAGKFDFENPRSWKMSP